MLDILAFVEHALAGADTVEFCVLDPDLGRGRYAGERVEHAGEPHVRYAMMASDRGIRAALGRGRSWWTFRQSRSPWHG